MTDPCAIRVSTYVPESTINGLNDKQHAALWVNKRELLYGGAAGGGKSEYLLAAALQYVDVPGYAAILFRRSYTDLALPGALMDRAHVWLDDSDARWHEMEKTWEFPSGATLSFGYLKHERDIYRYQSSEFQFIGFDELTQFTLEQYLYLFSRLRGPSDGPLSLVPLRMRTASNPGGVGHKWVKDRFPVDGERVEGRVFIPASLYDNPHINQEAYVEALNQLDEQTQAQLLRGDWSVRGAGEWFFDHLDIEAAIELGDEYDRLLAEGKLQPSGGALDNGIDWGEWTQAYCIWPLEGGGIYIPPSEVATHKREPGEVTRQILVKHTRFGWPLKRSAYDAAGIQSMRTYLKEARKQIPELKSQKVPFNQYKAESASYMRLLLERTGKGYDVQRMAISRHNEELVRQLPDLESDPEKDTVWMKDDDQHGPDAVAAGVARHAVRHRERVREMKTAATNGSRNGRLKEAA